MKKVILMLALSATLVGCSSADVKKTVDEFSNDTSIPLAHNEKISEDVRDDFKEIQDKIVGDTLNALNINGELKIEEVNSYKEFEKEISNLRNQMSHKVENVRLSDDKNKAFVKLKTQYIDIGELALARVNEALERNTFKFDVKSTPNEFFDDLFTSVLSELNESHDFEFKEIQSEVELTLNNNSWEISKLDKPMIQALTLGFSSKLKDFKKKVDETSENKSFLEVESNLMQVFNELKKSITRNEIKELTIEEIKSIIDEVKSNTKQKISIGQGDLNEVYYIDLGENKNDIEVYVNIDNNKYKINKNIFE